MAVKQITYDLSDGRLKIWNSITELGNASASAFSSSVSIFGNLFVWGEIIEDATLTNEYRFSANGNLRCPYIQEGYTELPIYGSGSTTYDTMASYSVNLLLDGLNSGSREWNGVSEYGGYVARDSWERNLVSVMFAEYVSGSSMTSSLVGLGTGSWINFGHRFYGRTSYYKNLLQDLFETYDTGSDLNGLVGGLLPETYLSWSGPWRSFTPYNNGIKAYETFETYATGSDLNGQGDVSDTRWTSFSGSWRTRNAS